MSDEYGKTSRQGNKADLAHCGLAQAIDAIGDPHSLLLLREVVCGVHRFDYMQNDLGMSRSIMSNRLARLVESGVLTREKYKIPGQRQRYEYKLAPKGEALLPALMALKAWAEEYLLKAQSSFRFCLEDRREVSLCIRTKDGEIIDDPARVSILNIED